MDVRPALSADVDLVVALAQQSRRKLASWDPDFWAPAENADAVHRAHLTSLIESGPTPFYVGLSRGNLIASASVRPSRGWAALEEVHLATPAVAAAVLPIIGHRPLRTMVARADQGLRAALDVSDFKQVSTCHVVRVEPGEEVPAGSGDSADPPPAAPHPFGESATDLPDSFVLGAGDDCLVGRVQRHEPALFDRPGDVLVIDRVGSLDLLEQAIAVAGSVGVSHVIVVCATGDESLTTALASLNFSQPADVFEG